MDAIASKQLRYWLFAFLAIGLGWRGLRYALQFPIWGDEAMLCLNFVEQDYQGLTRPLRNGQVAPVLFLWSELTSYLFLGPSELALRLMPFLAGAGALLLFWNLCRNALTPLACTLAMGWMAASYYPVRHACEVKPYALDLFMAVALLLPAAHWLKNPTQLRPLLLLAGLVPLAIGFSYPAVLVASSVALVLMPTVVRMGSPKTWLVFGIFNALLALSFLGTYFFVGAGQVADEPLNNFLHDYWGEWMPRHDPLSILKWLVLSHIGNLMAYPVGGPNGASALTLIFCCIGIRTLWRTDRKLLGLCVVPFVMSMLAALAHRYPYGGSARLAQHLVPGICILAGVGIAAMLTRFETRPAWTFASCAVLIIVGAAGLARDLIHPFKTQGEIQARRLVEELYERTGPDDVVLILNPEDNVKATFRWYLAHRRLVWESELSAWSIGFETKRAWCLRYWEPLPENAIQSRLSGSWSLIEQQEYTIPGDRRDDPIERIQLTCWKRL